MRSYFGDILTKHVCARLTENSPQVLDKWLTEEYKTFFGAIFKVDVEVILFYALTMTAKLVLDFFDEFAFTSYF